MHAEFWLDRWREGKIAFHEGRTNTFLARHAERFAPKSRILVPLCGKAHDMLFLAACGHRVLGVEVAEEAVSAFFADNELPFERRPLGPFEAWESGPITILCGDFFATTPELMAEHGVNALYDRAALVALPKDMRQRYAAHVRTLLPAGARALVITFEYPQEQMAGPPFSVDEPELRALYAGLAAEQIDSAMADAPRFTDAGVGAIERVFTLAF